MIKLKFKKLLIKLFLKKEFFAIKESQSQMCGCLSELEHLCTSCVDQKADNETKALAESILDRILCSAYGMKEEPSLYIHPWEENLWVKYLSGEIKACGHETSCIKKDKEINKVLKELFDSVK